jgi:DNA-binding response OmpR family regulator
MGDVTPRILLADDDQGLLKVLGRHLETAGFEVVTAVDGDETLARVRAGPVDLIILDVMMPKKNGYEVCAQLKQDPATRQIPIIIYTAKGQRAQHLVGHLLGADAYVSKPFGSKELIEQVRMLLKGRPPPAQG